MSMANTPSVTPSAIWLARSVGVSVVGADASAGASAGAVAGAVLVTVRP